MRAVAIVNDHARRLTAGVRAGLEAALPGGVRFTRSLDHARAVIYEEVRRGRDLIVLGGGDGTVVMGLALVAEACRGAGRPEPAIGVLRLGSANAIADAVGATGDPAGDLARVVRGEGTWRPVPLIEVLGVRAPFVGLGVDAQLREDHRAVTQVIDRLPGARRRVGGAARDAISAAARDALSVALRALPRLVRGPRAHAVVRNLGAPAIEMARSGPTGREIAAGSVLWQGACTLIAGATIPFFGFGLRMFAFADVRRDRFHLRCGDAGLFEILRRAPGALRGEAFSDRVHDFLCDRVGIELAVAWPVQAGGELLDRSRSVELGLAAPVTLVALSGSASAG